jgi:hypothetical protein
VSDEVKDDVPPEPEEEMAPYIIEAARSSRSKCRGCRKKIEKGKARVGVLVDGFYGPGYSWNHVKCLARKDISKVEEAYELVSWADDLTMPTLESLRKEAEKAESKKKEKKLAPYAERAPTGRSKCKHCGEGIEKGAWRVAVLREVEFGAQVRAGPINVHPGCVAEALMQPDSRTEPEGFEEALRANSKLPDEEVDSALAEIGPLEP